MGERQRLVRAEDMATTSTAVATVSPQTQEEEVEPATVITLRPPRTQTNKKVVWTEDTVDNEHMNKKKSKCCCIYHKPAKFGESDSEDSDDECEHCFGHVEVKKVKKGGTTQAQPSTTTTQQEATPQEPTATITLTNEPEPAINPPSNEPAPAPAPPDHDGNTQ